MEKILLLGGTGFIGSLLMPALEEEGFKVFAPRIEIRDVSAIEEAVKETEPDIIINATGITGKPNVDWCEDQPGETYSVNVGGSLNVAQVAHKNNLYMVQLCSGCIYDGTPEGGFKETDEPNYFGSMYSRTRVMSEAALMEFPNVLQLRVRIPLMGKPHRKNLIDKLTMYPKMINKLNSCTVMEDFIPATIQMIKARETGVFNMTNMGAMDHKSIMTLYKEIVDPDFEINLMDKEEGDKLCERRSNTVLNTDKREEKGYHMRPLEESLKLILESYKNYKLEE